MNNTSESRYVMAGNLRLHLLDWGGGNHPPLFLLHGLASSCHMFDFIAPALTNHYHVYAVDQRGHGLSDKPSDGYDFETIASDLDNLANTLGYQNTPLTIVGHSWGAHTVLYYAATRPARTAKAVLLDGGTRIIQAMFPTWEQAEIGLAPPPYVNMTVDDIKLFIRKWQGAGFRPETEPLALTIFDLSDPHNVHARLNRDNNMQIAYHLWAFQPTDYYARVTCPLLVVNAVDPGAEITPQMRYEAQLVETQTAQVKVVWMRDTIHDIPWHRPQELIEVLEAFL